MVTAALIISIAALLASALCALAVMELIASRPSAGSEPRDDAIEHFELSSEVVGTTASSHGLADRLDDAEVEELARRRACALFGADHANV